ncbi:hypothetical protein K1719_009279 [Acacia pycnantha]|nr:hypothetical protein K1719_009279 [Acacia pycnantha]
MGKTIFHLCVTYNQLEILKDLVKLDTHGTHELLIKGDLDGSNTILHLAIMLKQVETVSYLILIPKIRSEASNLKNDMGYTAPDIVQRIPKDSKCLEIQVILMESGIKCGRKKTVNVGSIEDERWWWRRRRNVLKSIDKWLKYNGDWVEDMRGNLSLVATVVATITFQAALNPPGSVIQQGIATPSGGSDSNSSTLPQGLLTCMKSFNSTELGETHPGPCPGEAMFGYVYPHLYINFITYNTISFVASLCVALLLVSGVPLKHRFVLWMLSIGMVITLTCLLSAYFVGLFLITPYGIYDNERASIVTKFFMGLNALVGIYMAMIFVNWVVKKLKDKLPMVNKLKDKLPMAKKLKDKFTKHRKLSGQGTGTDIANNA